MGLRAGRYNFGYVIYDAASDVVYATLDNARSARRERSPEDHFWLFDDDGRFHGLAVMEPRERLERDGKVSITLPSGEHERLTGLEFAIRRAG